MTRARILTTVILLGAVFVVVGCSASRKSSPLAQRENDSRRTEILRDLGSVTSWELEENLREWHLRELDFSQLAKYGAGARVSLSKYFSDPVEQSTIEQAVRDRLATTGWTLVQGPTEDGFYHDYLYLKGGRPLVLSTGSRTSVARGLFVVVQFQ